MNKSILSPFYKGVTYCNHTHSEMEFITDTKSILYTFIYSCLTLLTVLVHAESKILNFPANHIVIHLFNGFQVHFRKGNFRAVCLYYARMHIKTPTWQVCIGRESNRQPQDCKADMPPVRLPWPMKWHANSNLLLPLHM